MSNPLFGMMGGGMNVMQLLVQFRQNPLAMLQRAGFSVPANISNPQQMIQHLMNSGQISQQQFDQARQMAQQFGVK